MVRSLAVLLVIFSALSLICVQIPGALAETTDSWPMYRGDLQRTGFSTSKVPATSDIKWTYDTDAEVDSSPVVVNGRVIVGLSSGDVVALNSTTGSHLWTYAGESGQNSIWSTPAVDSGKVYVGTRQNNMLCLNEATGALMWTFTVDNEVNSSPLVADGKLYFNVNAQNSTGNGYNAKFYCVNATDGSLIWVKEIVGAQHSFSSPTFADGTVFECTLTDLYALDAVNGEVQWNVTVDSQGSVTSTPVVGDGRVYINAGIGASARVNCIDASTGSTLWTKSSVDNQTLGSYMSSPALVGNNLIVCSSFGTVFNLNARTGDLNWKYKSPAPSIWSSPAVADGKVVFGGDDGKVYCLNASDASLIWSKYTLDRVVSSPAISDGTIYVGCGTAGEGRIYAFGAKYTKLATLTLSLDSQTSFIGFKVTLTGTLSSSDGAIANVPITLSYSVNGGEKWNDITAVQTDAEGGYEAVWVPSATGTYLVRASWKGEYPLSDAEATCMLSVTLHNDEYVFAVVSNVTVSALAFNGADQKLSFTLSSEAGTNGFVEVTLAKNLVPAISDLDVFVDEVNLPYQATSVGDSWLLRFNITFDSADSSHGVVVALTGSEVESSPTSYTIGTIGFSPDMFLLVIVVLFALVVALALYIAVKSIGDKKKANAQPNP